MPKKGMSKQQLNTITGNIALQFKNILINLGLDLKDDSLSDTPNRVAKSYVNELFAGLTQPEPNYTRFKNKYGSQMVVIKNISFTSMCEHHFLPIIGKAHIGYIPKEYVLGLSKFHRLVAHYSRRPQIQERLVNDIGVKLAEVLETPDVMVVIDAKHYCSLIRGVKDKESTMVNSFISGAFKEDSVRNEFLNLIKD